MDPCQPKSPRLSEVYGAFSVPGACSLEWDVSIPSGGRMDCMHIVIVEDGLHFMSDDRLGGRDFVMWVICIQKL